MAFIEPLNLRELLVTHFAGSIILFVVIALLVVLILGGRWKMTLATIMFSFLVLLAVFYNENSLRGQVIPIIFLAVIAIAVIVVPILYRKWS